MKDLHVTVTNLPQRQQGCRCCKEMTAPKLGTKNGCVRIIFPNIMIETWDWIICNTCVIGAL